ncbi:MAG: ZIP family metal transporter [Candidatus Peribacteria bacterium]|jgi:zinc and cadmium transporter|nr:ZIP family metal transporter [Candidatus Peribacteria bacterium]
MLSPISQSFIAVIIVSLISLIGIFTLGIKIAHLKKILIYVIAFSAGTMMGDVFFHLLPESAEEYGFTTIMSISII